jgi:hypothetical protein
MPEGFTVRLSSLAEFAETVKAVINDYRAITGQLEAADLTKKDPHFDTLLGKSNYQGSREINDAARAVLNKYTELYSDIARAHVVIQARLEQVAATLGETHQLYADLDATHHAVYHALLDEFPADRTGGDYGTAGSW